MIKSEKIDQVLLVTFGTDEQNRVEPGFAFEFRRFIEELDCSDFKVIVVAARGDFFSNGFDPNHLYGRDRDYLTDFLGNAFGLLVPWFNLEVPTVAALGGHAMGWGAIFSFFCDFRFIANKAARIGLPEAKIGLAVPVATGYRLADLVGHQKSRDLAYWGRGLKANEALEIGLVDDIFEKSDTLKQTLLFAEKLARSSRWSLVGNKAILQHKYKTLLPELVKQDVIGAADIILHPEAQEGLAALSQGRRAKFF